MLSLHGSAPEADYEGWLTELVPTAQVWEARGHMLRLVDPQRFAARGHDLATTCHDVNDIMAGLLPLMA